MPELTPRTSGRLLAVAALAWLLAQAGGALAARTVPPRGRPGLLVIRRPLTPGADLADGRRVWTWPRGAVLVTDSTLAVTAADSLLELPFTSRLRGTSQGRGLLFQEGTYPVDGTLVLADDGFTAVIGKGRLTISADSLVVTGAPKPPPQAAQLLLLAGIALLTFALIVRSRSRLRSSS